MPKGVTHKKYTGQFKKLVVETMRLENLNYAEAAKKFDINSHGRVQSWEKIYLEEGPQGLYKELRGRPRTANGTQKGRKIREQTEEDLSAEIQRLRAEVAYLKNLQALVMEEERHQRKKHR